MENIGNSTKSHDELKKLLSGYNGEEKYLEKKAAPAAEPSNDTTMASINGRYAKNERLMTIIAVALIVNIVLMFVFVVILWFNR